MLVRVEAARAEAATAAVAVGAASEAAVTAAVVRAEAAAEQHRLEALEHARRIATRRLAYLEARSL